MSGVTVPDLYLIETKNDPPGISNRAEAGTTNAERIQATVVQLRADIAEARRIDLVTVPDAGYPNANTNSTAVEMVSNRITIPSAPFDRILRADSSTMFHYSQIEAMDVRLYLGDFRIGINRVYGSPAGVFRSVPVSGKRILLADEIGVVEVRHVRAGGTGVTTPSAGSGSWHFTVETERVN